MKATRPKRLTPGPQGHTALAPLSRRAFLRLAGSVAALTLVGGCRLAAPSPTPRRAEEQVQLVYQDWRTDWFPPMAQRMLEEFHSRQSRIRVFYTPDPEDLAEKMLADMAAGTAPDVFAGCCTFFPIWAQSGRVLDLRPYVEAHLGEATVSDWDRAQYDWFFTRDGRQFALPKYHGALGLYYNKRLFDEAGIGYPDASWDMATYLAAMKRLARDRTGDGRMDQWGSMVDIGWDRIQVYVNAWGGHLVDPDDPARCRMCDPEALAAMEWLRARMWDDKVMATFRDVENLGTRQAFVMGKLAMVEDGSWALRDILEGAEFPVGIAPFPAGPVRRVTLATTDGFGIYAATKHPDEAWELMEFLISPDYGRAMAQANFLQPARASLVDEWVNMVRAEFPDETRDLDIAAFADGHIKGYSVTTEIMADMALATQATQTAWDQIYTLGESPVQIMELVCRQIGEVKPGAEREGRGANEKSK